MFWVFTASGSVGLEGGWLSCAPIGNFTECATGSLEILWMFKLDERRPDNFGR